MVTVAQYVEAQQIVDYFGWTKDGEQFILTEDSVPSIATVEEYVSAAEEEVEKETRRNWRDGFKSVVDEYHSWSYRDQAMIRRGIYGNIITIDLYYENIQSFTKLELWEGDTWKDLVISGTEGQAMFNEDYFIDKKSGRLYIHTNFPSQGKDNIKLTYKYGEFVAAAADDMPKPLKKAVYQLAGSEMVITHGSLFQYAIEDSRGAGQYQQLSDNWREQGYMQCDRHRSQKAYNLFS